jgi:hypothetical protein
LPTLTAFNRHKSPSKSKGRTLMRPYVELNL